MSALATSTAAATAAARLAALHPLVHGPAVDCRAAPDWQSLLQVVRAEQLAAPMLLVAQAQLVRLPPEGPATLERLALASAARDVALEQVAARVVAACTAAGIDTRLLKGPASAHLVYPDPVLRSFRDVDLLVRGTQLAEALTLLEAAGAARLIPSPGLAFDARLGKGAAMRLPDRAEVDLHRTLTQGPFGILLDADALFAHQRPLVLANVPMAALGAVDAAIHAAIHAVCGEPTLSLGAAREVVWTASTIEQPQQLVRRAEELGVAAVLAQAVRTSVAAMAGAADGLLAELAAWARSRPSTAREARWLAAYGRTHRRSAHLAAHSLAAVHGWDRVVLGRALLAPAAHRSTPRERIRRAVERA